MSGSLEDPIAKLDRALHHYKVLYNELHWGVNRKLHPVSLEPQREALEYIVRVGEVPALSPDWPLVMGDCVHNLRAALDHLVYQLHVRRYKGVVPPDVAETCSFPIFDGSKTRKGKILLPRETNSIMNLAPRQIATIEWLQPYNTRDDQLRGLRATLKQLHTFDIIDKHRHLHFVEATYAAAEIPNLDPSFGFKSEPTFGPLISNTQVDHWTLVKPLPISYVNMQYNLQSAVALEHDGVQWEILEVLAGMFLVVTDVLHRFDRQFPVLAWPDMELLRVHRTG